MDAYFYTLGCKVNQYETQAMMQRMEQAGYPSHPYSVGFTGVGDGIIVINSCTVTGESDRKLRQLLRRCRRDNPGAILVLTGCMPQAFPDIAETYSEADIILGNAGRAKLPAYIGQYLALGQRIVDITPHGETFEALSIDQFEGRTRAFVKIQDGCNRFCAYCIIPYARGRVRSRPLDHIREELTVLAEKGYREVVLVGINLTSYGQDLGLTLADAVETACAVPGIERVRLGSLEPDHLFPALLQRLAAQPKLCPQFHLSLQSGCDATLKRMRRHYTTAEFAALCARLREMFPDCALTTDVMVGFPGETEEEFQQSLDFVKSIGFAKVHIFAYSRRKGTPAAEAPDQVPAAEKARRSKRMAAVCEEQRIRFEEQQIGKTAEVLLETRQQDGWAEGYTRNYLPVRVKTDRPAGSTIMVRITGRTEDVCLGEEIQTH